MAVVLRGARAKVPGVAAAAAAVAVRRHSTQDALSASVIDEFKLDSTEATKLKSLWTPDNASVVISLAAQLQRATQELRNAQENAKSAQENAKSAQENAKSATASNADLINAMKDAEAKATLQLIERTEHINARALQDILEYELGIDRSNRQQSWKAFFMALKRDKSTGEDMHAELAFEVLKCMQLKPANEQYKKGWAPTPEQADKVAGHLESEYRRLSNIVHTKLLKTVNGVVEIRRDPENCIQVAISKQLARSRPSFAYKVVE